MEQLTQQMPDVLAQSADHRPRASTRSPFVLTRREREVLMLLYYRETDAEIADRLGISRRTVSSYVGRILEKLAVRNRREAGAVAWDLFGQRSSSVGPG